MLRIVFDYCLKGGGTGAGAGYILDIYSQTFSISGFALRAYVWNLA